ncbi:sulfatase family protein [Thermophagus sp. OGC60D27]|uniref:sulfatase family protein n=1 Tax=Thermophagus sp. OGC60D27 TaxID=3458415 RepID=UPI004037AC76
MKSFMKYWLKSSMILMALSGLIVLNSCSSPDEQGDQAPSKKPNVLWFFVEDINPWLKCYGHDLSSTPNIDRLVENGVVFENAFAAAPVCSPARSSIITGVMATTLGTHQHHSARTVEAAHYLPDSVTTVPELFREAGYYTYNNGKDDYNFTYNRQKLYSGDIETFFWYTLGGGGHWRDSLRQEDQPFFGQIQITGGKYALPHPSSVAKYEATLKKSERVSPNDIDIPPYFPDHPMIRKEWALHYDAIKMVDYDVERVLKQLEEDGELENTVIFFFSDHGFEGLRHKQFCYEGGIHIPFIVSYFGDDPEIKKQIKKGTRRGDLISAIDVTATSLAIAGLEVPEFMESRNVFAKDFHRDFVVSTRDRCDFTIDRIRSIRTKQYKYIRNFHPERSYMQPNYRDSRPIFKMLKNMYETGQLNDVQAKYWEPTKPKEELYDIAADPHEINNLAADPQYAEVLKDLRGKLDKWILETDDKGQYPEKVEDLRFIYERWLDRCVNPEFDYVKANPRNQTPGWIRDLLNYPEN